ncbi:MAG: hypothetical protein KF841_05420 [Phycisphaerae bacterium]|nr:hypothetical protein [Phycisphaerae bacterium]
MKSVTKLVHFVGVILPAWTLVGCSGPAAPSALQAAPNDSAVSMAATVRPVRWVTDDGEMTLASIEDIDELFAMPVAHGGGTEGPAFRNDSGAISRPLTCKDYFRLIDSGYDPPTTYDMSIASFFVLRCDTLRYIRHAAPANRSYIESFRLSTQSIEELPAELAPTWQNNDAEWRENRDLAGSSWATAYPADVITPFDSASIDITGDAFITNFRIVAWADFNHDGLEDVLLFLAVHVNGGTFRTYYHKALTRLVPEGPLIEVELKRFD